MKQASSDLLTIVVMITDFSNNYGLYTYSKIISFLDKFNPLISVVDVTKSARYEVIHLGLCWF